MLVDAHNHLQDDRLWPHREAVLARARNAGIGLQVVNGTHPGDWERVAQLARKNTDIVPFYGLHPWEVSNAETDWLAQLEAQLASGNSGIGEIGLDRWISPRDEAAQEAAFRAQLQLATRYNRPCAIHCLRAWGWLMDVLRSETLPDTPLLLHSYGGSTEMVDELLAFNVYFSFSGSVAEPKRHKQREALRRVPLHRLLLETDAPDMLPPTPLKQHSIAQPDGPEANEPANLPGIVAFVARERDLLLDELIAQVQANSWRFLGDVLGNRAPKT